MELNIVLHVIFCLVEIQETDRFSMLVDKSG